MAHEFPIRVYYEDTDLAGIVYYANYLKFIERGRSEFVRALGVDQVAMKADYGVVFAVRRVEADYLRPAKFDDELVVTTDLVTETGARLVMEQTVQRDGEVLFTAQVTIVCLNEAGAAQRLPADIRRKLAPKLH
ncbi:MULTISPECIES: tol-pal system-associated acyl-CoA thioesterase [unclassified Thioclava]|uniref:tol-pal system-associated acyl-CoA thioesterase n=1 Tax=unclassified Thioclava TaxID=2621713 RepID=UPI000B545395|nr:MULTISPECIES: tol-pal system-associated acyl-CoA thioesterase [unclassified Thioclava]OWY00911.1 tol-pal system-associated acyl-CoA thioesterase [Thioclava sp. IC9]OWY01185.1 tol-pal system-associated acyl-CoA thioesterase [Thioclava sp. F1Mire-8]OWY08595.1 tol-pal system-associated acyl-CoA thioesterase [Thioclava sp. F42-5]OWY11757.1 tol-pal system-associated acyl-CoA thioesterase [Thioclava sp. F34-6]OWY15762.1 tol-pal system-associated acyl-CoA thioesterase [Thioclava sp. JM3]